MTNKAKIAKTEEVKERVITFLAPIQGVLPDKFSLSFEVKDKGLAKFSYQEEFINEEQVKKSMPIVKHFCDLPGVKIKQEGCKVILWGEEVFVPLALGMILGEILGQSVYYIGMDKIKEILKLFPEIPGVTVGPPTHLGPVETEEVVK